MYNESMLILSSACSSCIVHVCFRTSCSPETTNSTLETHDNRSTLESVYGLSSEDLGAIEQSMWHSTGPSDREWREHCRSQLGRSTTEVNDTIGSMNLPRRVVVMLEASGIKTISRVKRIISGDDDEFIGAPSSKTATFKISGDSAQARSRSLRCAPPHPQASASLSAAAWPTAVDAAA